MSNVKEITVATVRAALPDAIHALICSGSYESRCLTVPEELAQRNPPNRVWLCFNQRSAPKTGEHVRRLEKVFAGRCEKVTLERSSPVRSADKMSQAISQVFEADGAQNIVVDITTFTHEALLILLQLIVRATRKKDRIFLVYASAEVYAVGLPDHEKWLSRGIKEIRSVLGYPGEILPSRKSHLIVLLGFEYERARQLIEEFDPNILSVGVGRKGSHTSEQHNQVNRLAQEMLSVRGRQLNEFEFSCVDIDETERSVYEQIERHQGTNVFIAPMNTKLSTVAVAGLAIRDSRIQLCYASALQYNVDGYSLPGEKVLLTELTDGWPKNN